MKFAIAAAVIAALSCSAASASAQSLADLAKKEEARRTAVRAQSKTLTNANLGADPREAPAPPPAADKAMVAPVGPPTGAAPAAAAAPGTASADGQAAQSPADVAKKEVQPEAWWRTRAQQIRDRIAQARKTVDELTAPQSANPAQQARLDKLMKSAQDALARAEQDLKTLAMNADVAGVPATWIR